MMNYFFRCAVLMLVFALPAAAQDFEKASLALCEKVKSCALQQMGEKEITPEMRQMLEPMFRTMCDSARQYIKDVPTGHEMYPVAVACMNSMAKLSCAQMENLDEQPTPECAKYEAMAKKYD